MIRWWPSTFTPPLLPDCTSTRGMFPCLKKSGNAISHSLKTCLPDRISSDPFEAGLVGEQIFDLSPLKGLLDHWENVLISYVIAAFSQGWPKPDAEVTKAQNAFETYTRHGIRAGNGYRPVVQTIALGTCADEAAECAAGKTGGSGTGGRYPLCWCDTLVNA